MMVAFTDLRSQLCLCLCFPKHTNHNPSANPIFLNIPTIKAAAASSSTSRNPSPSPPPRAMKLATQIRAATAAGTDQISRRKKPQTPLLDQQQQQCYYSWKEGEEEEEELCGQVVSPNPNGHYYSSKFVMVGAVSVGVALFLIGLDGGEHKALALGGPEGPLVEEFWDNMRRYALYILTVSTGVAYTIFQPILELLKNPISAILILTIFGGSIFIVSQVLSAMVGVSDFDYQYGY